MVLQYSTVQYSSASLGLSAAGSDCVFMHVGLAGDLVPGDIVEVAGKGGKLWLGLHIAGQPFATA